MKVSNSGIVIVVKKSNSHGGTRAGSGQPAKWGEPTKVIRVPQSLASKIELIIAIPELIELLEDADKKIAKSPTSPRHDGLKELVADIRNLGF